VHDADNAPMSGGRRFLSTVVIGPVIVLLLAAGVLSAAAVEARHTPAGPMLAAGADATGVAGDSTPAAPSTTLATPATTLAPPPATAPPTSRPSTPTTLAPPPTRAAPSSTAQPVGAAVDTPVSPGQTSWTAAAEGMTISVHIDRSAPRAGDAIQFDVDMTSPTASVCCSLWYLSGDGYTFGTQTPAECPVPAGPTTAHFVVSHTYNLARRWTFTVQAGTVVCGTPGPSATLSGTIEVGAGTTTAQGPSLPQIMVDYSVQPAGHLSDYSWLSMAGQVVDDDGWVRSVTIDWGDGTAPLALGGAYNGSFDPNTCMSTAAGWPVGSRKIIFTGDAIHHYSAPGTYVVTTTGRSTACDGVSAPQTATARLTWSVPPSA
jgi:hypothetical protein